MSSLQHLVLWLGVARRMVSHALLVYAVLVHESFGNKRAVATVALPKSMPLGSSHRPTAVCAGHPQASFANPHLLAATSVVVLLTLPGIFHSTTAALERSNASPASCRRRCSRAHALHRVPCRGVRRATAGRRHTRAHCRCGGSVQPCVSNPPGKRRMMMHQFSWCCADVSAACSRWRLRMSSRSRSRK